MLRSLLTAILIFCATQLVADTIRVASFNTELERRGPGLLLRDIASGKDQQVAAVVKVIALGDADIIALQSIDWDLEGATLRALMAELEKAGAPYPYFYAAQPNSGRASGYDLDGNGRLGEPEDSWGFGAFTGQSGIAVLSRFPIHIEEVRDFSGSLWRDLPDALLPVNEDGTLFPSEQVYLEQPLSSTAHWAVPIELPNSETLTLLTFKATPPVFDGPEDRNGRRNHDEIVFWQAYLDGDFGPVPDSRFVIAGDSNLDPHDSEGRREAMRALLSDARIVDPAPTSNGGAAAGGQGHTGPDALDTVDWDGPGRLRVDYVLPSRDWTVMDAGVLWPGKDAPEHDAVISASRHRLVWVDLTLD
ncbi:MAG: endonuclease/exonuclease/phosphatase family protein [Heliomarina sp.]|uniref:endonuclease/exonuclease/phosphatase family protein n=1 Tax=Heliomarina sp. TaxID=2917556 RepID=UPI00405A45F2